MRVLLVHAEFPRTYWGFQYVLHIAGKRASLPPLGLISLAAHLPAAWQMRLVDLNVAALRDDDLRWADVVLVGGMLVQAPSIHEVIARARAAGKRTVVGGPAASTAADDFADADLVFGGEVEGRVDELVAAIEEPAAAPRMLPAPAGRFPAMSEARVPRYDLLDLGAYTSMAVQYSRGCPFTCEFCDVIEIFGRRPRVKSTAQVLAELGRLHDLGWRGTVFLVDDNFIGNLPEVRKLLPEIIRWQRERGHPFEFYTEASVNLARELDLPGQMVEAGFSSVFLGIETPSTRALAEAGKKQNLRQDIAAAVTVLTRAGLEVMGGFIVGFDSDGPEAFEAQRRFLADAPIPLAMVGLLIALPGTALWRRLEREGRLRASSNGDQFGRPNFEPRMDEAAMLDGYAALLRELYDPDAYLSRCERYLRLAPPPVATSRVRKGGPLIMLRTMLYLGVLGRRRRQFWSLLGRGLRRSPRHISWLIAHALQGEHCYLYTQQDVLPRLARARADLRSARSDGRSFCPTAA